MAELDVTPARRGTVGDGVHVGLLAGSRGLDVDLVVVLGAVEGLLPPPPSIDPLLGDDERMAAGLAGSAERAAVAHRQFLAAVTTTDRVLVTVPRGDLRATTAYHPTRWLAATGAHGDGPAPVRMIDSHVHGLASTEFPVSPTEHRVRELWTRCRAGGDVRDHPLVGTDEVLARAVRLRDARASDEFTEYDGDLSSCAIAPVDGPIAPTRIEAWPACPHAYFVRYLLGVRPVDEPEDIVSVTALDKGSALHEAVHRLHQAVLDGDASRPGPAGWADEHVELLARFGADGRRRAGVGGTDRAAGVLGGRPARPAPRAGPLDRGRSGELAGPHRAAVGGDVRPGRRRSPSPCPAGGRSPSRARSTASTSCPTARSSSPITRPAAPTTTPRSTDDDPTLGGTRFQLPIYAAAARVLLHRPDATVLAEYAFFEKAKFRRIPITLDERSWALVGEDLSRIIEGIEAGVFPAIPDPPGYQHYVRCQYCQPDGLGTAERWPEWERKRHDERLARWFPHPTEADA